jgi:hypothetical protein
MEDAIERLHGIPNSRDLKYGVLHLAAAIEVLLKLRLVKEHWSLVFEQLSTATLAKYEGGDFKSVNSAEALRRLRDIALLPVTRLDELQIENIVKKRNRLQHFGLDDSAESIQAVTAAALDYVLDFVDTQLRDPDSAHGDPIEQTLDRIREQLADIEALVRTRMESLEAVLDASEVVLSCPSCMLAALVPGELCKCLYCLRESQPEDMAEEYVYAILGENEYTSVKDGGVWPLHWCPSCESRTLVEGVNDPRISTAADPSDRTPLYWVCFSEGIGWAYGEISYCTQCGVPTTTGSDDGVPICSDCYAYLASRD